MNIITYGLDRKIKKWHVILFVNFISLMTLALGAMLCVSYMYEYSMIDFNNVGDSSELLMMNVEMLDTAILTTAVCLLFVNIIVWVKTQNNNYEDITQR